MERKRMKSLGKKCIDCGSEAIDSMIDEIRPLYRMTVINYACGAVLKSTFSANGNIGKAYHSGCLQN